MFKGLAENFRVIAFDSFSHGANTKMEYCSGLESAQKAEASLIEWYTEFMASIDHILPEKFNMLAMCSGCYPMGLYAAANKHRI